jgi:tRNA-Thr(GGU) m(6)t(6)A37 methyltransferase TsaA
MQYPFEPIGFVRSPYTERMAAPRQAPGGDPGRIELLPGHGFEDALEGLDTFDYAWVLFVFHQNVEQRRGWSPKVQPPRSNEKYGVFATRSPHRPNPIGLSCVRIDRVEGLVVHVRELDLLDGTPVLDIKPYVPYADARPDANSGWLEPRDPAPAWTVTFSDDALAQLAWLEVRGVVLRAAIEQALALGPQPHAYRRIRRQGAGYRLALKEWRIDFAVDARVITVRTIASGYRPRQLATNAALAVHRDFAAAFDG